MKPDHHQFVTPWDGVPGTAANIIAQRREFAAQLAAAAEAAAAEADRLEAEQAAIAEAYDAAREPAPDDDPTQP